MIRTLIILLFVILFIILSSVVNHFLYRKIKDGHSESVAKIKICLVILIPILYLSATWLLPNAIKPAISYSDFGSYLFWTEGYQEEGFLKADAYLKTDYGYLYSIEDEMLSGLAREKNGKYKANSVDLFQEKKLEVDDRTILLQTFENSENDLNIFLFLDIGGDDFEASVNGISALVYSKDSWLFKVCVMEKQNHFTVTCNGKEFKI